MTPDPRYPSFGSNSLKNYTPVIKAQEPTNKSTEGFPTYGVANVSFNNINCANQSLFNFLSPVSEAKTNHNDCQMIQIQV
jgi:hypothetical protein